MLAEGLLSGAIPDSTGGWNELQYGSVRRYRACRLMTPRYKEASELGKFDGLSRER